MARGRKRKHVDGGQPPRKKTTAEVAPEVLRDARIVAAWRGMELREYVDSILRPVVERDRREAAKEMGQDS